jgi:hypothetical protein
MTTETEIQELANSIVLDYTPGAVMSPGLWLNAANNATADYFQTVAKLLKTYADVSVSQAAFLRFKLGVANSALENVDAFNVGDNFTEDIASSFKKMLEIEARVITLALNL